ncbi:MAG: ATP-binding cassette domain-containing protein, partial [Deltaproteobacteria bacterium]|nr:ATP-binding cassette domain-containing protein [Deltaproteobacteria bacterium]
MSNLLEVQNLSKLFPLKGGFWGRTKGYVRAVHRVSLSVRHGEIVGLVGESGCGKSTLGRTILKLLEPTEGKIVFDGTDITKLSPKEMRPLRREMQIIFQDPYASLNPRMTIGTAIAEPLIVHKLAAKKKRRSRVVELLEMVGLNADAYDKYPHEFSGGQRQRVGIARALSLNPRLIIADEPVSALDVSIQAQIINLLSDLQKKLGLAMIFIAHDLKVVEHISQRIVVMYLGEVMETFEAKDLYNAKHPYTKSLLSAIPVPDPNVKKERIILKGDVPSPINPPTGCVFHTRCPIAVDRCRVEIP